MGIDVISVIRVKSLVSHFSDTAQRTSLLRDVHLRAGESIQYDGTG